MSDIVFDIVRIIVFAVFMIASKYVIPLLVQWLKSLVNEHQYKLLFSVVTAAVQALEQEFKGQSGQGAIKKEQVVASVKAYCEKHGIDISDDQIDKLIEAAVFGINKGKKE